MDPQVPFLADATPIAAHEEPSPDGGSPSFPMPEVIGLPPALVWSPTPREVPPTELTLDRESQSIKLINLLFERSGMSQAEIARRIGIKPQSINQYMKQHRTATFLWVVRLAQVCGAKVSIEFPTNYPRLDLRATKEDL
jgi:DNA-binding XRE family transcriptional regulator